MPKFVIDEDMPPSTGAILKEHGYDVKDVRDYGLRGFSNSPYSFNFAIPR